MGVTMGVLYNSIYVCFLFTELIRIYPTNIGDLTNKVNKQCDVTIKNGDVMGSNQQFL